ncbi:S46 family peptidase [Gammaproteobacteria bacterium]|jgi:hypothetical protein|nr:S46 family peptidase [Gammaproteobacteria bacterium]MDA9765908.1 S46 family peptidase [Gammaproteobacteria bacterium]MDC1241267.1 S46 family peptidase [Gammaproteobacteria bacterium]
MLKIILLIIFITNSFLYADEGMWEPYQMKGLKKELRTSGYNRNVSNVSDLFKHPMSAIVSLGGCSAAFVSDEGLIATNYHCIERGFLQFNSNSETDLFETGFVARTKNAEKRSAPGSRVYVTLESTEITEQVLKNLNDETQDIERAKIIEKNIKEIISMCETSDEIECRVRSFFSGETYKLEKVLKIKDVRLVYAPPAHIGEYGGEIDNWMYPRHTGDFALLRAYTSKDGSSKEFNKDNVPYKSNSFLKISAKGVDEGDFVMVVGYPGRTNRLLTFNEIKYDLEIGFHETVEFLKRGIELIDKNTNDADGSGLKYRGLKSGYENYFKKISGQIDGAENFKLLISEESNWKSFLKFVEKEASKNEKDYLDALLNLVDEQQKESLARSYYGNSVLISQAKRLYRNAVEKEKIDSERKPGYQERDQEKIMNRIKSLDYSFDLKVDKAIFTDRLSVYAKIEPSLRRPTYSKLLKLDSGLNEMNQAVDEIYSSQYKDSESFLKMMEFSLDELNDSTDPLIVFAKKTYEESLEYEKKYEATGARRQLLKSKFIGLLKNYYESSNRQLYADANGTLRVTYGNVAGVSLEDGVRYEPFTRLEGIVQKHTNEEPFDASDKLLKLINNKDYGKYFYEPINSVPVNFLSTLDITNGNSGSATINSKFELVGLAFDGMLETIIADYKYIPQARTISVDSRYLLWTLEKLEKADNILEELTIVN